MNRSPGRAVPATPNFLSLVGVIVRGCAGPVAGSLVESRKVPPAEAVYPLPAINDSENASLWPTTCYLLALIGLDDWARYGERADTVARFILSMQDDDGSFNGNINFYASLSLWSYSAQRLRGAEPSRPSVDVL